MNAAGLLAAVGQVAAVGVLVLIGAAYGWVAGYQRAESMHPTDHDHDERGDR